MAAVYDRREPPEQGLKQMCPTPLDNTTSETISDLEQLVAELRAHERSRLDLVQRHECELAEAEAQHQSTIAVLQARSAAAEKAYHEVLAEVIALTRMVVELETRADVLATAHDESEAASAVRVKELRSTITFRDLALADAHSCLAAAEEELAALRSSLARDSGDANDASNSQASDCELLRDSALFDANWYLRRYEDVAKAGVDPVEHYLAHGAAELRDPGPAFSTAAYLGANPDVAESGTNALVHYLRTGLRGGRAGRLPTPPDRECP